MSPIGMKVSADFLGNWACPLVISLVNHHQSLNREGRWGTTDDFATSFLHFSLHFHFLSSSRINSKHQLTNELANYSQIINLKDLVEITLVFIKKKSLLVNGYRS